MQIHSFRQNYPSFVMAHKKNKQMGVALVWHKTPTNIRALRRLQSVIKKTKNEMLGRIKERQTHRARSVGSVRRNKKTPPISECDGRIDISPSRDVDYGAQASANPTYFCGWMCYGWIFRQKALSETRAWCWEQNEAYAVWASLYRGHYGISVYFQGCNYIPAEQQILKKKYCESSQITVWS